MPKVACVTCKNPFYSKPSWIQKGFGKYCSTKCYRSTLRKGRDIACEICGRSTYKQAKDIDRSKSGKFFCNKSCQTRWRNQLYIGELHKNFTTGESSYRVVLARARILKLCRLCKTSDSRVLAVHHIDKNRKNNKLTNLAWLCHNCHFLVHQYEGERVKFMATMV